MFQKVWTAGAFAATYDLKLLHARAKNLSNLDVLDLGLPVELRPPRSVPRSALWNKYFFGEFHQF